MIVKNIKNIIIFTSFIVFIFMIISVREETKNIIIKKQRDEKIEKALKIRKIFNLNWTDEYNIYMNKKYE
tara:strand:+ start:812 stop:1021 length:210 start_codon:yes stop_codon:yes gene_type:complete